MKSKKKKDLPSKVCPVCSRPFSWRKKWQKVWGEVRYCSEKCRNSKHSPESRRNDNGHSRET